MDVSKYISYQIQSQFPAIYQEEGSQLVDLITEYYKFLESDQDEGYYATGYSIDSQSDKRYFATHYQTYTEAQQAIAELNNNSSITYGDLRVVKSSRQSTYHNRRLFDYNDIDNTLERMLMFYKSKYLNELPLEQIDIRFVVKHIMDFYRRKGTHEGLQLFFRLFFRESVDVYYPSTNILKPSSSKWKSSIYVELFPQSPDVLRNAKQTQIFGTVSGASAVIDSVNYIIVDNTFVPIVYLTNVQGTFVSYDNIVKDDVLYGTVRGSLSSISISDEDVRAGVANNNVGDIVDIFSATGFGAKGRVTSTTSDTSGEIYFNIKDGGFGYTTSNTDIIISDQVLFFNDPSLRFEVLETISQANNTIVGNVVGQRNISSDTVAVGVLLSSANSFVSGNNVVTVDRDTNITAMVQYAGPVNSTASVEIGDTISNIQTISIITDLIEDFINVSLDSTNYSDVPPATRPMTGISPVTITTLLSDAFVPQTFEIGTIDSLKIIDPGSGYDNDVFVLAKENTISRFGLTNQNININPLTGASVEIGSIVVQNNPAANTTNLNIRGIVKARTGDTIQVMPLSFEGFTSSNSIYVEGSTDPIEVIEVERDYTISPIGLNAIIDGFVNSAVGKIRSVDVVSSGFGFVDSTVVNMKNATKLETAKSLLESALNTPGVSQLIIDQLQSDVDKWENDNAAQGTGYAAYQGTTQGSWLSKTSHLNSKMVIQDSDFYQDFSYQVISKLAPQQYSDTLKTIAHVSGTKLFHKFSVEDTINTKISMTDIITRENVIDIAVDEEGYVWVDEEGYVLTGDDFISP